MTDLVTAAMAAEQLRDERVSPAMVRLWASRGRLEATDVTVRTGRGRVKPTYRMADVWRAYAEWARKKPS